jgi:hypothetical protein
MLPSLKPKKQDQPGGMPMQERTSAKNVVQDFIALRPMLTSWGLRVIWWLYLIFTTINLVRLGSFFQGVDRSLKTFMLYFLPSVIDLFVQVLIVRILLEVALRLIESKTANSV